MTQAPWNTPPHVYAEYAECMMAFVNARCEYSFACRCLCSLDLRVDGVQLLSWLNKQRCTHFAEQCLHLPNSTICHQHRQSGNFQSSNRNLPTMDCPAISLSASYSRRFFFTLPLFSIFSLVNLILFTAPLPVCSTRYTHTKLTQFPTMDQIDILYIHI